ncbi:hypothetical protein JTB14_024652 [Gonioctena quinquepunctata]|nr:hypothetical protein JTB14_024652 [Gonioctena quinquepunctata]
MAERMQADEMNEEDSPLPQESFDHHRIPVSERTALKKKEQWQEICNLFGDDKFPIDQLNEKWKYLGDCFVKACKKKKKYIPSGSGVTDPTPLKISSGTITTSSVSLISDFSLENPTTNNSSSLSVTPNRNKVDDEALQQAIISSLQQPPEKSDAVDVFLQMLGASLRRLPIQKRMRIQIQFMQIVYKEECDSENG